MSDQSSSGLNQPKRKGSPFLNILLFLLVLGAIGLFAWAELQRREVAQQLQKTEQQLEEIRKSTQSSGQEVADRVLEQVRQHYRLPEDPQPTVATIVDVDSLRQSNEFYNQAENGDHLIITENRAILYDPDTNLIIDVVPVVFDQEEQAAGQGETAPAATPGQAQPTPTPSPAEGQ